MDNVEEKNPEEKTDKSELVEQDIDVTKIKEEDEDSDSDEEIEISTEPTKIVAEFLETQREAIMGVISAQGTSEITDYNKIDFGNAVNIIRENRQGYVRNAYTIFTSILEDNENTHEERMNCIHYLVKTNMREYIEICENYMMEFIYDENTDPSKKYELLIKKFVCSTSFGDVRSRTEDWWLKLNNELLWIYYTNENNSMRDRILSAQYLLGQSYNLNIQRRKFINEDMEENMKNEEFEHSIRSDIADVLIMYGDKRRKRRGNRMIKKLGFEKGGHTIYDDAENVHNEEIKSCIHKFVEDELSTDKIPIIIYESMTEGRDGSQSATKFKRIQTIEDINDYITKFIKDYVIVLNKEEIESIDESMRRISLDTATFTKKYMRVSEVLQRVWNRIMSHDDVEKKELLQRLIQELIDARGTCSSGHMERIVAVLSGYEIDVHISWDDQIVANIKGRLNALIRDMDDETIRDEILDIMIEDEAPKEKKDTLKEHIIKLSDTLKEELKKEFIEYISEEEFTKSYDSGLEMYLSKECHV